MNILPQQTKEKSHHQGYSVQEKRRRNRRRKRNNMKNEKEISPGGGSKPARVIKFKRREEDMEE